MKKVSVFNLVTVILLLTLVSPVVAVGESNDDITLGKRVTFHSKVLKEDRALWIYPADALEKSTKKRPVMYLLDGSAHFRHICGLVHDFKRIGMFPDMLVVALPNVDRNRDFLPKKGITATGGKADAFLSFFKKELIPYMEKKYNAAPFRILFGHSFGGVFNFYSLFAEPQLFNAHIAVSPSLWFGDAMLVKKGEQFFKKGKELNRFLFYSMGNEGPRMEKGADAISEILKKNAPKGFEWEYQLFKNENHGTTPHITAYKALRKLFSDWQYNPYEDRENQSMGRLQAHFKKLSKKYAYKIVPTESSVNNFGYMFVRMKKFDQAIEVLSFNVRQYPGSPNVYDSLGEAYETKGDLKAAKKNYAKAAKIAEKKSDSRLDLFKRNLNRVKEALKKAK